VDEGGMAIGTPFEETEAKLGLPSTCVLTAAAKLVLRKLGFGAAGSANLQHLPGYPNSQARFSPDSLQICGRKIFTDSHSFLQNFVVNQEYGVN